MTTTWQNTLKQRWQALSARERRGVFVVCFLLTLVLTWQLLIAQALDKLRQADAQRPLTTQQLTHMQALQAQAQALRQRTPMSRDNALKTLQGLTVSPTLQLNPQGERVLVTLKAVPAPVLSEWLAQARTQAQALPSEVHLTRTAANASAPTPAWDGNLVLVLPRGTNSGKP